MRLVQGYGRFIRSKEDWAKTYVIDSAFLPFVRKNINILPNWFIQAIQSNLTPSLARATLDSVNNVSTTSQDHHNQITINHHSPTNISEKNEISFYIASQQSGTLTSLDSYNEYESIRPERLFNCPYCPKFSSTVEREYQRHIVLKHRGKSGYPNASPDVD